MNAPFSPPPGIRLGQWDRSLKDSEARIVRAAFTRADLIDHARFVANYERRMTAIYDAPASERPAMTQQLRKEMANVR